MTANEITFETKNQIIDRLTIEINELMKIQLQLVGELIEKAKQQRNDPGAKVKLIEIYETLKQCFSGDEYVLDMYRNAAGISDLTVTN